MVYSGNRYSEDLDFNGPSDVTVLQALWQEIIGRLLDFGISAERRNEWASDAGYSFDVSFQGPLYDGRTRSKGKVRMDINRRQEEVVVRRELVMSEYDDVRPFVVTVLAPEHLLAEKTRALLVRGKPRDMYDIWLLLNQGVRLDDALIERKLALYAMAWDQNTLRVALDRVGTDWERDLRHLLPQFVPYEIVREGIIARLS
jgi:predicted nucleotidyltransferase component of viral defense system